MSLKIKKKSGSSVPPMEAGTYPAVCVGIVDLGEQYNEAFKKYTDKMLFIWEILWCAASARRRSMCR